MPRRLDQLFLREEWVKELLAIVAPGGVGVREAVFLAFLTPALGSGPALALTVASRLLLTLTEALAAVAGLALRERRDAATSS